MKHPILADVSQCMLDIEKLQIAPYVPVLEKCPTGREVTINGKNILFFSSNNYLGLADNKEIIDTIIEATKIYGFGSGASRLVGGTFDQHVFLEEKIAKFKSEESAIIFATGSITNDTVIPALLNVPNFSVSSHIKNSVLKHFKGNESAVFSDELNHASIVDGCRLASADRVIYKHLDLNDLEEKLKHSRARKKLIVTDSIFSMDGDVVDIVNLIKLKEKYGALLYVDEAHSSGVMGTYGKGISEEYSVKGIDIKMGTFSKAFGGAGGFIAGNKELVDYLRFSCRKYIFSTAMPPALAAGLVKSIEIVEHSQDLRENLKKVSNAFRGKIQKLGFDTLTSTTQIVPVFIGDEKKTMEFSRKLFEKDILAPSVIWPATPRHSGRLRVSMIATHTEEDINRLIDGIVETSKEVEKNVVGSSIKSHN